MWVASWSVKYGKAAMSRVGNQPILLGDEVTIEMDGQVVTVKGPKGELTIEVSPMLAVEEKEANLVVTRVRENRDSRAMHGLTRTLLANMVAGVTRGWEKQLELRGIGYRARVDGRDLVLTVGFSHPITVEPPEGISFAVDENRITVLGIDKALVGQVAANIRATRKPEPYKGKGIRYLGEEVKIKPGKAAKVGVGSP